MNKIIKEKSNLLFLVFLLFFCNQCFAEGQDGIAIIINSYVDFGHNFMIITNILLYTIIGGLVINAIFFKNNLKLKNRNLKSFSISFILSILLTIIFQDKFTLLIYNVL